MMLELILLVIIFGLSLLLVFSDFSRAVYILIIFTFLLHKELFSIYRWDVLPIRLLMLAVFCFGVVTFIKQLSRAGITHLKQPFTVLLGVLAGSKVISLVNSSDLPQSILLLAFFANVVALGYVCSVYLTQNLQLLEKYLKFYTTGAFVACLIGFLQLGIYLKYDRIFGALWNIPGHTPRVGSTFWDVNHFGGLLVGLLPLLGVQFLLAAGYRAKLKYFMMVSVMAGVLLLTSSRTAWIGAGFSALTFIALHSFSKFKLKGILVLLLTLGLVLGVAFTEYQNKNGAFRAEIRDYFHYRIDSFDSHLLLLRGSLEIFAKYPVIGVGYGSFFNHFRSTKVAVEFFGRDPAAFNTKVPPHTIWGELLSETGVVGLSSYILFMGLVLGTLYYAYAQAKTQHHRLYTSAMFSALIGWMFSGIFYSYNTEFFWLIIFLYYFYALATLPKTISGTQIINFFAKTDGVYVLLLGILGSFIFFYRLGGNHLLPWDEAIYAQVIKNLMSAPNPLVLSWRQGFVWFEKPPLYMWLALLSVKTFGLSEFAVRLPSALFGFATSFVVYKLGSLVSSKKAGFFAAFVLMTTFQFVYYSRTAMLDVTVAFFISLSFYFYYAYRMSHQRRIFLVYSGLAAGLGVMTKGVIGLLPFFMIFLDELVLLVRARKLTNIAELRHSLKLQLCIFAVACLIFLPWHSYMYTVFGQAFLKNYIGYHVLDRALVAIEDKGKPIYWYGIVLKVSLRLWFIVLVGALAANLVKLAYLKKVDKSFARNILILVPAAFILGFFSVAKSKLVWYIIPFYPIISVYIGDVLASTLDSFTKGRQVAKVLLAYMVVILGVCYFYSIRAKVYTSDLTGKEAKMLVLKDKMFGVDQLVYVDNKVEFPLVLFYTNGPFELLSFSDLTKTVRDKKTQPLVLLTKESRCSALRLIDPNLLEAARDAEWVLCYHDLKPK